MDHIKVSLFASAVRPKLWPSSFNSLRSTSVQVEKVFAGNATNPHISFLEYANGSKGDKHQALFKYIETENIKPAQCYEIARRACVGETVIWTADDAEYPNDVIGKAYNHWKSKNDEKLILSIQTKESGYGMPKGQLFDMRDHCFFGYRRNTPLMAPLALMSRKFLDDLGGIDRRYTSGQYENDIVMRAIVDGGKVEIFGGPDCFIDIDHLGKSLLIGESRVPEDFNKRPFAAGYPQDRKILESSWVKPNGTIAFFRNDTFEPFEDKDILTVSQSNKGIWI